MAGRTIEVVRCDGTRATGEKGGHDRNKSNMKKDL